MPTDPAVEALARPLDDVLGELVAWVSFALDVPVALSEAALDHIAAHLHADTPEGAALRQRLGLATEHSETPIAPDKHACNGEGWRWWCRACNPMAQDCPVEARVRLVSPWRDA